MVPAPAYWNAGLAFCLTEVFATQLWNHWPSEAFGSDLMMRLDNSSGYECEHICWVRFARVGKSGTWQYQHALATQWKQNCHIAVATVWWLYSMVAQNGDNSMVALQYGGTVWRLQYDGFAVWWLTI